ncbi:hypothetical protein [Cohnella sp. GCM10027633]|uniref:hypothetical protein n=1 Tax=unclassified Cohnella TaxID=2636738 RepID=UPI00363EBC9A
MKSTRRAVGLLVMLAMLITGMLPHTAGVAEAAPATIQTYPMPSIYTASGVYSLKADTQAVPVVSYLPDYDYAQFSFAGKVAIEVTANAPITSYSISPLAKNIEGTVSGNKLTFSLSTSTYVIVEINGMTKKLVIAADPLETNIPPSSGAGIYNVTQSPFNADNTGATMASGAIQQAIMQPIMRAEASYSSRPGYTRAGT